MIKTLFGLLAMALWVGSLQAQEQCGRIEPCVIEDGDYYMKTPANWDGRTELPVLIFFHGHAGSGEAIVNSQSLDHTFGAGGYLIIAPNGAIWSERGVRAWPARPMDLAWRDDIAFTLAVLDDAAARVPLDRERVLVSGFSAGGSMAWMLACYEAAKFTGFAPIAGAIRRPLPENGCDGGAAPLIEVHGFKDLQVPLEGRAIRDWHQGDVFESLELTRQVNQCASLPSEVAIDDLFSCRYWNDCATGAPVAFCLHDGGHSLPKGWAEKVFNWLEGREID